MKSKSIVQIERLIFVLLISITLCLYVYAINEDIPTEGEKALEPKELILQALQQMDKIKGCHYQIKMTTKVDEVSGKNLFSVPSTMEGFYRSSDNITYGKYDLMGNKSDVYQKGKQVIVKVNEKWIKGSMEGYPFPSIQLQPLKTGIEKARFVGEEKIKGEICHIADVSVNQKETEKLLNRLTISIPEGRSITYTYKVWLGKEHALIYKLFSSIDVPRESFKEEHQGPKTIIRLITELELFDYDTADIDDIVVPKEVIKALVDTNVDVKSMMTTSNSPKIILILIIVVGMVGLLIVVLVCVKSLKQKN